MTRYIAIIALMLLAACATSRKDAGRVHEVGVVAPEGQEEMQDKGKEAACDCCQKCNAAKGTLKPQKEEGALESNGCEDCCTRCGKELQPRSQEAPPEVIEHGLRPELKDNK